MMTNCEGCIYNEGYCSLPRMLECPINEKNDIMTREEAIERIKIRFDKWALDDEDMKAIQTLIPELKESDDERIRKLLVWQVYRNIEDETNDLAQSVYDGIKGHDPDIEESIEDWKRCLAWLEKQKENPKSSDSIPSDCTSDAKCEDRDSNYGVFPEDVIVVARACEKLKAHGYTELAHALKNVNLYTKEQKPVDYDHEMWKNCEANFEGGKKEVIDHPEKYGLQKPDTRDADDLQLLGFIYDLLNEIEWKDNWAMSKDECLRRLNNYRPQKPAEWNANDKAFIKDCARILDENGYAASAERLLSMFPVKQEWSEEDEEMLNLTKTQLRILQSHLSHTHGESMSDMGYSSRLLQIEKCVSWLDIRLRSLRPQPQGTYKQVIHTIFGMLKDKDFYEIQPSHRVSLLNDIRVKCKDAIECAPILDEPSWKPREEQMEALNALNCHGDLSYIGQQNQLISLYNDLKKLM